MLNHDYPFWFECVASCGNYFVCWKWFILLGSLLQMWNVMIRMIGQKCDMHWSMHNTWDLNMSFESHTHTMLHTVTSLWERKTISYSHKLHFSKDSKNLILLLAVFHVYHVSERWTQIRFRFRKRGGKNNKIEFYL